MPPKTPAKTHTESPEEPVGPFMDHAAIMQAIEQRGGDTVIVAVWREGGPAPVLIYEYLGSEFTLDKLRQAHGAGRYALVLTDRGTRSYIMRRTISVAALANAPTQEHGTADAAPAPKPNQFDPMAIMMMMMQSAETRAAQAQAQTNAILQAIITRPQVDPLDAVGKLAPLLKQDNPSDPASIVRLAREMGRDFAGAQRRERDDDDADDGDSPLAMLGAVLAPIVQRLMAGGIPAARPAPAPQPPAPRHVPNTAQQTPESHPPVKAGTGSAPAPAPFGGHGAGAGGAPSAPASPAVEDDADEDTGPEGYTYTDEQLGYFDECETSAEQKGFHPCIGDMCAVLKIEHEKQSGRTTTQHAEEILAWFKWWSDGAAEDLKNATNQHEYEQARAESVKIYECVQMTLAQCAAFVDGEDAIAIGLIAESAGVPLDFAQAVARAMDAIARPRPTQAPYVGNELNNTPAPTPEPTPAPAPAAPKRTRNRAKPKST